jgi:hypothetical protein
MGLELVVPIPPGYGLLRPEDLTAVKAATLYGDCVRVLMHLSTHMATGLLVGAPEKERAAFLRRCVSESVIERAGYPPSDGDDSTLTLALARIAADYQALHARTGPVQLDLVVENDVFTDAILDDGEPALVVKLDPGIEEFTKRLSQLMLSEHGRALVLTVPSLLRTNLGLPAPIRERSGEVALSLLSRLPGFAGASLADIVDIRSELGVPLTRFRAAVVQLSTDDIGSAEDVGVLWTATVAPALQDIDDLIHDNRYLRRLFEQLLNPTQGAITVAGVVAGVAALRGVPQLLMGGLTTLMPPVRAAWQRHLGEENLRKQRFFFLHEVKKRL